MSDIETPTYRVVITGPNDYHHVVGTGMVYSRAERVERGVLTNLGEDFYVAVEPE